MENPKKSPSKCNFAIIFTMQHVHRPFFWGPSFCTTMTKTFFGKVPSLNLKNKIANFFEKDCQTFKTTKLKIEKYF